MVVISMLSLGSGEHGGPAQAASCHLSITALAAPILTAVLTLLGTPCQNIIMKSLASVPEF
jgi:hypothetical protein